jgi:hypothetical protein
MHLVREGFQLVVQEKLDVFFEAFAFGFIDQQAAFLEQSQGQERDLAGDDGVNSFAFQGQAQGVLGLADVFIFEPFVAAVQGVVHTNVFGVVKAFGHFKFAFVIVDYRDDDVHFF